MEDTDVTSSRIAAAPVFLPDDGDLLEPDHSTDAMIPPVNVRGGPGSIYSDRSSPPRVDSASTGNVTYHHAMTTQHLGSPSYAASSRAHTNTSARSSFSLGSAPGPGTPAKITQEDIAYARMGGGGYPVNGGVNGGVNGVSSPAESTAALLALQREQTLLAAAAAAATNNDGWSDPSDVSDTNPLIHRMQGGGGVMGTHAAVTGYPAPVVDPSATQSMNPAADPFPRKGPSGPRRAGEGVE